MRLSVAAGLVACTLAGAAPALAGDRTGPPDQDSRADGSSARTEHRPRVLDPRQTSGNEPGEIATPIPTYLRATPRQDQIVSWWMAPGVTFTRWRQTDARGPIRAHLVTVDTTKPGVHIDYASMGQVRRTATVPKILARDRAIAGVNGDFYDIGHSGAPLGLGKDRQRGLVHGRKTNGNAAFYIGRGGRPGIGRLPMKAAVRQHPEISVTNLNSPAVAAGGVGIYTHGWGRTTGYGMTQGQRHNVRAVWVAHGQVVKNTGKLQSDKQIAGLLLVGRGPGADKLRKLRRGTPVKVSYGLPDRPQMAITGSQYLVHDGIIRATDDRILHPRTAVGVVHATGEVLLLAVDGRSRYSRGYTMVELANLMIDLGADEAINLDGGGSTTMVGRGKGGASKVLNRPSDGFLRWVANAVEVTYKKPKGR